MGIHEECGLFGIYDGSASANVALSTYCGLYALQHRGQESCGITVNDDGILTSYKDVCLAHEVFDQDRLLSLGKGKMAIGHVRYSGDGVANRLNAQPLMVRHIKGPLAVAHNGALINGHELKEELEMTGAIFHTTCDAEIIAYMITRARLASKSIEEALEIAMTKLKGAYSLVIMSPKKIIAARDPQGFRPLCLGTIDGGYVVASETCALDSIGAKFLRDVEPGEIVILDENGLRSNRAHCGGKTGLCVFEYVYTARPDSVIDGVSVHAARLKAGAILAQEHPVEADVVIGVPDSGLDAALGYARESGIPYGIGFIKNRYVGRTFILPTQAERVEAVHIKLNVLADTVKGKRVIMVDDSIVRGTTSANIVRMLREAGATEVHMRVSSPPFINPCYFGTDIDDKDKLIACKMSIEEIGKQIGVDSLGYLSVDGIKRIAEGAHCDFCTGCFTGVYPIEVPEKMPVDKFCYKISEEV